MSGAHLPSRGRSLSLSASGVGANALPTIPSLPMRSDSLRGASSPSGTPAGRSFGFASDRSPLQMLELELKHISKEESATPGLGRSLSKKQEARLQQSTTISSRLTASPASPSSSSGHTRTQDQGHHYQHHGNSGTSYHRHRMANLLGGKVKERERDGYHDNPFNTGGMDKSQAVHHTPAANQPPISGSDRVDRKVRHHRHGYQFQHVSRRTSSISSSISNKGNTSRLAQAAGGERVFDGKVAHLTLEDGGCDLGPAEHDGMANLYQEGPTSISHSHTISHTEYPSSLSSPHPPPQLRKHLKAPTVEHPSSNDSPDHVVIENPTDGYFPAFKPKATFSEQTSSPVIASCFSTDTVSKRISQTKEEMRDELIMSFIRAIPCRPAAAPTSFSPPLNIKCGPLLRYTGLRRAEGTSKISTAKERETWRGSVMIVTTDDMSDYSPQPVIRLFFEPKSDATGTKVGPGRATSDFPGVGNPRNEQPLSKNGEGMRKYREVEATKLHAERGVTFWRFNIEVELGNQQTRIGYRINRGPSITFWVPANGETMNIMFHSCNGFSLSVNPDDFCGPDPLWSDVLREHQQKPFHVMLGGGDQSMLPKPLEMELLTDQRPLRRQT